MKIKKSEFMISAVEPSQYPEPSVPEIAFAGRSNVGKSSLLNMLLNRKGLAKTSARPGKTQTINFFNIDDCFRMVDLPGYGFARVSKSLKERWGEYIEAYLQDRENLLEVFLLVDIRHAPNEHDIMMYEYIKAAGFKGYIFCTKLDKLKNSELMDALTTIRETLRIEDPSLMIPISSENRKGKYKAWDLFNQLFVEHGYSIHFERQMTEKHWLKHQEGSPKKKRKRLR
jgi:GTP-binding protein